MKRLLLCLAVALTPFQAFALTADIKHSLANSSQFYNPNPPDTCDGTGAVPPGGGGGGGGGAANNAQLRNTQTIIGIAKTLNLGKQGALIGLMTALAESSILNDASQSVPISITFPHDAVPPGDHDSVGIFQQRAHGSWSPVSSATNFNENVKWLMTPAYSAEAFFAMPEGKKERKALVKVPNWQSIDPALAAQAVQVSAFSDGSNYRAKQAKAQGLVDKYYDTSPAVPLPVPLASGGGGGSNPGGPAAGSPADCATDGDANIPPGPITGCVNPFAAEPSAWGLARTDQGVDYIPKRETPVRAICDGIITQNDQHTGWGGEPGGWIGYKLTSGPFVGKCIYVAEQIKGTLPVGTHFKAGQVIGTAHPKPVYTEWGWTKSPPRHQPSTPYNGAADGTPMPGGKAFARFLRHLGAKTLQAPGAGPEYAGATCP